MILHKICTYRKVLSTISATTEHRLLNSDEKSHGKSLIAWIIFSKTKTTRTIDFTKNCHYFLHLPILSNFVEKLQGYAIKKIVVKIFKKFGGLDIFFKKDDKNYWFYKKMSLFFALSNFIEKSQGCHWNSNLLFLQKKL